MEDKYYFPYKCRDDAVEEYRSLRNEILESQKQRIYLLQFSLIIIGALFGYLVSDKSLGKLSTDEALFLTTLTIAPSLFSYSTRCRERRIAKYLKIFLEKLTIWSDISSGSKAKLNFFQRSSTTIVFFMILLDIGFLLISCPLKPLSNIIFCLQQITWDLAIIATIANIYIAFKTSKLPTHFEDDLKKRYEEIKEKCARSKHNEKEEIGVRP